MKDITKKILKIAAIVVAFAIVISSVFIIRSCSAPPDYEEIRSRVEELIEASFDVNDIVWGEGLPTYERIMKDPVWSVYKDGDEQTTDYYYYYLNNVKAGEKIVAFRPLDDKDADFRYATVTSEPTDSTALSAIYPVTEANAAPEDLYCEVYSNAQKNIYAYLIPYVKKTADFYYTESDDLYYDYVISDAKCTSIDSIKELVRTVYAPDYAESLDSMLFDGVTIAEGEIIQKARYVNGLRGQLTKLNTFEPLFTERRVYLYNTAKIDRANSNDSTVVVEFSTYLPSEPDKLVTAKITLTLSGDVWYLASPTY